VWDIETSVVTNPMATFKKEGETDEDSPTASDTIDATTDAGVAQLESMGLPIKIIRT
jgi:hypothetical protein